MNLSSAILLRLLFSFIAVSLGKIFDIANSIPADLATQIRAHNNMRELTSSLHSTYCQHHNSTLSPVNSFLLQLSHFRGRSFKTSADQSLPYLPRLGIFSCVVEVTFFHSLNFPFIDLSPFAQIN